MVAFTGSNGAINSIKRWGASAALAYAVLVLTWLVPPIFHTAKHLCPVRPDATPEANAVPAFARKYGMSCMQCHSGFPVLNGYGRQFRLQGYVRNVGNDEGTMQSEDKQLYTEKIFPWGVIIRSRPVDNGKGTISNQGQQMGATINNSTNNGVPNSNPNGFKSQPINDVDLFLAGGDVARKLSWFGELDANTPVGVNLGVSDLKLGWHPSQYLHIVAMRRGFFVDDPYQTISGSESPTIANRATDLALSGQSSLSGNRVTTTQQTMYGYGQLLLPQGEGFNVPGFIYYAAGAAKDDDLGRQSNAPTNMYGRLAFDNGGGFMVGAFGAYGHELQNNAAGLLQDAPEVTSGKYGADFLSRQQFVRVGFDSLWEIGDLAARGVFLYLHDGDRNFGAATATDRAAYAELAYYYKKGSDSYPFLVPLIRENWYTTLNGTQQFNYVTTQLQHYFSPNWKIFVEYSQDTKRAYQGGTLRNPMRTVSAGGLANKALIGNRATLQMSVGF